MAPMRKAAAPCSTSTTMRSSRSRFGLAVHRAALFGVLLRRRPARGIAHRDRRRARDAGHCRRTCNADRADGRRIGAFDLVVDASGARSKLRACASSPSEPKPLAYGAFWASLGWRGDGFDEHALLQRYDKASVMIGVLPIGRPQPGAEPMAAFFWSLKPAGRRARSVRPGLDAWKARVAALWPECESFLAPDRQFRPADAGALRPSHAGRCRPGAAWRSSATRRIRPARSSGRAPTWRCSTRAALAHALAASRRVEDALEAYVRMRRWHVRVFQALSLMPSRRSTSRISTVLPFIRDRLVATVAQIPPAPQLLAVDGGWNHGRSVQADRYQGSAVAASLRRMSFERCEPFACRNA